MSFGNKNLFYNDSDEDADYDDLNNDDNDNEGVLRERT